jgi:hypothetical protein
MPALHTLGASPSIGKNAARRLVVKIRRKLRGTDCIILVIACLEGEREMEIHKILILGGENPGLCCYCRDWNGIPVYITDSIADSRSAVYRDGTGFIIISTSLLKLRNEKFLLNKLWHEVSHLFYKDVWRPWNIEHEFRADMLAAAATGTELTLARLCAARRNASSPESAAALDARIRHIKTTRNTFTKRSALQMLSSIRPVKVLSHPTRLSR